MIRWILIVVVVIILIVGFIYFRKRGITKDDQFSKTSKVSNAKIEVQFSQIDYDKAYLKYTKTRTEALACKSARDAQKYGIGKNKACHIDKLSRLNKKWDEADTNKNNKLDILNDKKELLVIAE